jgi:hypothetical protein
MLVNEKRTEPNSVFAAAGHPALRLNSLARTSQMPGPLSEMLKPVHIIITMGGDEYGI